MDQFDLVVARHQLFCWTFNFFSDQKHLTRTLCQQACGDAEQGAFARATFPNDGNKLSFGKLQIKILQSYMGIVRFSEGA